jgi:hypothetical protein
MSEFLADPDRATKKKSEFCRDERLAYFNYMKDHAKVEYENIMRIEANNYW